MIDKRTLLPRLAILGGLALSLPVYAQYSSPVRDIDDSGRQPFQVMSQNNSGPPGSIATAVLFALPASATKRLVLDYISLTAGNNTISQVQTTGIATIEIRITPELLSCTFWRLRLVRRLTAALTSQSFRNRSGCT